jgi:hypothetical protein
MTGRGLFTASSLIEPELFCPAAKLAALLGALHKTNLVADNAAAKLSKLDTR